MDQLVAEVVSADTNAHHVLSFDNLLSVHLPDIVQGYGKVTIMVKNTRYTLQITAIRSSPTRPTTTECHTMGLNYLFCVRGTLSLLCEDVLVNTTRIPIAYIPMMTGRSVLSNERDALTEPFSGLFLSKGKCRTIPPTKSVLFNIPLLAVKNEVHTLQVRSAHSDKIFRSTSTFDMSIDDMDVLSCRLPFQPTAVTLRVLVLALGGDPEHFVALMARIAGPHYHEALFCGLRVGLVYDHRDVQTQTDGILFVSRLFGKTTESTGTNVLRNELFPHVGTDFGPKLAYLCMCSVRLFLFHKGLVAATVRDAYSVAQITTSAGHLGSMVRLMFIAHMRTCGKLLRRMLNKPTGGTLLDLAKVYGEHRLSSRIMSAVASGTWSTQRKGVSISLTSNNFDAIESQLRRISSSLATTNGNHTGPRSVMNDQYGFVCAASSPDGDATGLIYELGLTATVSPPVNDVPSLNLLLSLLLSQWIVPRPSSGSPSGPPSGPLLTPSSGPPSGPLLTPWTALYIDASGSWAGCLTDAVAFVAAFRVLRRTGRISPFVFIEHHLDFPRVQVTYQEGILCRPLLVCSTDQEEMPDNDVPLARLLATGMVEYVSPAEQSTLCHIALGPAHRTPQSTHVELTQSSFLGKLASSIAFATGQQGPRLAYSTLQRKQIITGSTKRYRGATETNQLWNTHRPLVRTTLPESSEGCRGVPVVLAMLAMPQNQEDAIIMKRSTLERGAFTMSDSREYTSEIIHTASGKIDRFERPHSIINKKTVSYEYVQENGLPLRGTFVPGGSVIIGKTRSVKRESLCKDDELTTATKRCDISTCTRVDDAGIVTHVERSEMPQGTRVRVVVTTTRVPEVGDKFTSQYAQKGVIGAIWDDVDMPFSMCTGVSPDLIVSPLSMTSRMTMSSLLEALCGKSVSVSGDMSAGVDDQDFAAGNRRYQVRCEQILREHGFAADGTESFVDGRTGEPIQARVFVGVVEYSRLVHLASKKIHARSTGPRDPLTRQPRDGRRFGGGLRIGEMESSALAAHGSSRVLQERFRELSDAFEIYTCTTCQLLCDDVCTDVNYAFCRRCQSNESVRSVLVPFTFLVLMTELLSTGIVTKLHVDS